MNTRNLTLATQSPLPISVELGLSILQISIYFSKNIRINSPQINNNKYIFTFAGKEDDTK